jgi:integrase
MVEADYKANARKSADRLSYIVSHLREFFGGDCKARDITSDRITAYVASRLEEGAARATCNYETSVISRGFQLAIRAGKAATKPIIDKLRVDNARQGFVERDSLDAIVRHLPEYVRPAVLVGFLTGWRRGEILSRQWRHADLKEGWLRLEGADSKNGAGREFPVSALPELQALLEAQRSRVSAIEKESGQIIPWVFPDPAGGPIEDFRKSWRTACRAAGRPGQLFHDLRRSAIRNLERAGVSRSVAMASTGHKTEAVYRRYAIVDSISLREGIEKLANSKSPVKVAALPFKRGGETL